MLAVERSEQYARKLHLLSQAWYVWSTGISKIHVLTVTKTEIGMRTFQYDSTFSFGFMWDPWDFLRQKSPNVLSRDACPVYIRQLLDFSGCLPLWLLVNKERTSDQLIANCRAVKNPCYLQSNAAWPRLSAMYNLAVTCFIFTWSEVYIPQEFPLLFVIIFLSYSTQVKHDYTYTSARCERHLTRQITGYYSQYVTLRHTARMETPVSSPQWCQCGHQKYNWGCTFKNHLWNWNQ